MGGVNILDEKLISFNQPEFYRLYFCGKGKTFSGRAGFTMEGEDFVLGELVAADTGTVIGTSIGGGLFQ